MKRDIEAFLAQRRSQPLPPPATPATAPAVAVDVGPTTPAQLTPLGNAGVDHMERELSMMRATIARRMALSKTTVPHFYLTTEIDMERAITMRQSLNALAVDDRPSQFQRYDLEGSGRYFWQFPQMNVSYAD